MKRLVLAAAALTLCSPINAASTCSVQRQPPAAYYGPSVNERLEVLETLVRRLVRLRECELEETRARAAVRAGMYYYTSPDCEVLTSSKNNNNGGDW